MAHKYRGINKKRQLQANLLRRRVLQRFSEGASSGAIADEFGVHQRTVFRHLAAALGSESLYPSNLSQERVGELRVLAGEKIRHLYQQVVEALAVTDPKQGMTVARLAEAATKLIEREARLFGLDQPTKIVQDMMQISYRKEEQRVVIEFDESQIAPDVQY
jgi:hypothetical protein